MIYQYGKCSKILNTFLFLFSNKMLVIKAGIYKRLIRIPNSEDQIKLLLKKQSDLSLHCLSVPFCQATSVQNSRIFTVV